MAKKLVKGVLEFFFHDHIYLPLGLYFYNEDFIQCDISCVLLMKKRQVSQKIYLTHITAE